MGESPFISPSPPPLEPMLCSSANTHLLSHLLSTLLLPSCRVLPTHCLVPPICPASPLVTLLTGHVTLERLFRLFNSKIDHSAALVRKRMGASFSVWGRACFLSTRPAQKDKVFRGITVTPPSSTCNPHPLVVLCNPHISLNEFPQLP